ncbi:MAG: xanthine dehydrogenase family protein subunit M [Dehalococcoidia bacterium]|nr:xanthine dehydrogenase family protein subunit M [Dehalococcoidia bacterium]
MQAFEYVSAKSVGEAVGVLSQHGEGARLMAGGTDVLVQLRAGRRPQVKVLVDVKGIGELNELSYNDRQGLIIGAAVPCYRIYEDPTVIKRYPGIVDSASIIGSVQIQGRASLGGNICNATPSADGIPPLIALGAVCIIAGPNNSRRELPLEQLFAGPGRTTLQNGEMLISVRVPPPPANSGAQYLRFTPRNEMDIAVAGVGAAITLNAAKNTFVSGRVVLAAVAPIPLLVPAAGQALAGKPVNDETIGKAAEAAVAAAVPITDMRGTIEYRKHLVGVLTRRALQGAIQRAKGV